MLCINSGFLDSAVIKQGHDRKEFLLRDERKDALQCVFYEIVSFWPFPSH